MAYTNTSTIYADKTHEKLTGDPGNLKMKFLYLIHGILKFKRSYIDTKKKPSLLFEAGDVKNFQGTSLFGIHFKKNKKG